MASVGRLAPLMALAVPVLAGLAYMAANGAPPAYLAINAGALVIGGAWALWGSGPSAQSLRRAAAIALLAAFSLPLLTGPQVNNVARWVPIGPLTFHSGMLVLPALALLAARDAAYGAAILLAALLIALLQPDAASAFAVTFAAVGVHHVNRDWKLGVVAIIGFVVAILAALRGELPAQPFVERVLVEAAGHSLAGALGLFLALSAGFLLMLWRVPGDTAERFAVAGTLFGFAIMALMANYPTPLIGFGASPILGYALALGLARRAA